MGPMEQIDIKSSDFWVKVLPNHQKNWAVIEPMHDGTTTIFFVNDASCVFDQIKCESRRAAEAALCLNGFQNFKESDTSIFCQPSGPFVSASHYNGLIYSSGKFWVSNEENERKCITRVSKNRITIEQVRLACRHVHEMLSAGVTENLAIRILEHFVDVYSKLHNGGAAVPYTVNHVKLWSVEAIKLWEKNNKQRPGSYLRVEHGTPRRALARIVLDCYENEKLDQSELERLIRIYWKVAVITLDEDARLNKICGRSKLFASPEARWAAAGIEFPS